MASEEKERYGWMAALVAASILAAGRVMYSVFQVVFSVLRSVAN